MSVVESKGDGMNDDKDDYLMPPDVKGKKKAALVKTVTNTSGLRLLQRESAIIVMLAHP